MTTDTDSAGGGSAPQTFRNAPDEAVSETVVRAVAEASGRPVFATDSDGEPLAPLYETIDPDALDALFRGRADDPAGRVRFVYSGHEVTVDRSGAVTVSEP